MVGGGVVVVAVVVLKAGKQLKLSRQPINHTVLHANSSCSLDR